MPQITTHTGGIAATNAHLLSLPGGTVLVDAPEGAADWLRTQGVKVDVLFLTHQHFDHVLEAAVIKAEHGCKVYAFSPFSRRLTLEELFGIVMGISLSVPEFTVDEVVEGLDTLEAVGETWKLYHVPGHSPDSVCYHLESQELLFDGDTLLLDGTCRTDFPGGSQKLLFTGIETKLLVLPDATRVFPGHGDDTTIGRERLENPYFK